MGKLVTLPWRAYRNAPQAGAAARGRLANGRLHGAPHCEGRSCRVRAIRRRPKALGASRQAVVVPTNTWQAYNFYDADGDGFGDTWYAGGNPPVVLTRPYRDRGVPPRFHRYDAPYLRWLSVTGKTPGLRHGRRPREDRVRRRATAPVRPRRLPGAHRVRDGARLRHRPAVPRPRRAADLPLRERILLRSNEHRTSCTGSSCGETWAVPKQRCWAPSIARTTTAPITGSFIVANAPAVPWLFEGTDLQNGSTIGDAVNGYGIKVDAEPGPRRPTRHSRPRSRTSSAQESMPR